MGPNTVSPIQSGGALIAMSGGVDSSIAAYLTMQTGCPCLGATMRLYRNVDIGKNPQRTCCAQKDIDDASQVAFQLDLPYEVLDLTARFRAEVMDKFVRTYEAGGTPNPCIDCNRSLKFDTLLALAREKGLSEVVTGHYARIVKDEASGRYVLKKALDRSKAQSYVLYTKTQDQLAHTRFPLRCKAKTRYRQQEEWATVTPLADGKIQVTFDEPQRAMTVGQAVVLYDGHTVVGGGTILSVLDEEQGETL